MRRIAAVVLLSLALACRSEGPETAGASSPAIASASAPVAREIPPAKARGTELQDRILKVPGPGVVEIEAGTYELTPIVEADTSCATCLDSEVATVLPTYTRGLRVSGKGIAIHGAGAEKTILRTGSGVGIFFDGCEDCSVEGITVTGGERDTDRRALDAAVVVRNGRVTLKDCVLGDNIGRDRIVLSTVAGICGVAVREGGVARVEGCRISRNSWDGIAVLRGASAVVEGSLVDGVDRSPLAQVGGGRSTGVNVAWDGAATLRGNLIRRSETGVSASGDARLVMSENVVEDVGSYGLGVRSGDVGRPSIDVEGNAFFRVGGCGVVVKAPAPIGDDVLRISGNAFALTGLAGIPTACPPTAIDAPPHAITEGNAFHANKEMGGAAGRNDTDAGDWAKQVTPLVRRFQAWPLLAESQFMQAFGFRPAE